MPLGPMQRKILTAFKATVRSDAPDTASATHRAPITPNSGDRRAVCTETRATYFTST